MGFREQIRHYRSLSSKEQANKPTEHESMTIEQRKRDNYRKSESFFRSILSRRLVPLFQRFNHVFSTEMRKIKFFRYLHE